MNNEKNNGHDINWPQFLFKEIHKVRTELLAEINYIKNDYLPRLTYARFVVWLQQELEISHEGNFKNIYLMCNDLFSETGTLNKTINEVKNKVDKSLLPDRTLAIKPAAKEAGVSIDTLRKYSRQGKIKSEKINGRYYYKLSEILKFKTPQKK